MLKPRKMRTRISIILAIFFTTCSFSLMATEPGKLIGQELIQQLQSGGFNIYFRHAETNWDQIDRVEVEEDWKSCNPDHIRQLSDEGRANATRVGEAIRALNLPISEVLASPYCRTMETASLMNLGTVEPTNDIINLRVASFFGGRDAIIKTARQLLATPPAMGKNRILVAHGNVATAATPVYPDEAEGVIFLPDGAGGFEFVARLNPQQWQKLVTISKSN